MSREHLLHFFVLSLVHPVSLSPASVSRCPREHARVSLARRARNLVSRQKRIGEDARESHVLPTNTRQNLNQPQSVKKLGSLEKKLGSLEKPTVEKPLACTRTFNDWNCFMAFPPGESRASLWSHEPDQHTCASLTATPPRTSSKKQLLHVVPPAQVRSADPEPRCPPLADHLQCPDHTGVRSARGVRRGSGLADLTSAAAITCRSCFLELVLGGAAVSAARTRWSEISLVKSTAVERMRHI